jgi:superfamily II DNA or RNA helicase
MLAYKLSYNVGRYLDLSVLSKDGIAVPSEIWLKNEPELQAQAEILQNLVDNGFAEWGTLGCSIEPEAIYSLTEIDRQILEIPPEYPNEILIQSSGTLNQPTFLFKYGFYSFVPNGERFQATREGPFLKIDSRCYLLTQNQYKVCEALDAFNILEPKEKVFCENLKRFADIKSLSREAAVLLDGYLANENVVVPDKIKVDVSFSDGTFEVTPNVGIEQNTAFVNAFDTFPSAQSTYAISDKSGARTRIVFTSSQKEAMATLKKECRKVRDPERVKDIVEAPFKFLDSDIFDLEVFYSDRVISIGVYKPKFYPFVCPYKSEWIPGIQVEDRVNGTKRITFETEDQLTKFASARDVAKINGKDSMQWEDVEIPLDEADRHIKFAKRQLNNPTKPNSQVPIAEHDKVLIIEENAERLGYNRTLEHSSLPIEVKFHTIDTLATGIQLRRHQTEGIAWLQALHGKGLGGCLLADDMGLGKTLQLLYFLEWHSQCVNSAKPYLVVAPVSLLENWRREHSRFFPRSNLPLLQLHDCPALKKEYSPETVALLQKKQIILTNYESVRRYQLNICAIDYAVIVLDEAQKIKTPGTLATNAAKALKADFKIAMTGTPVENTLVDLWCIMDFAAPGLLGNAKDFASTYQHPLRDAMVDQKALCEQVRQRIGCYMLRRLKNDVVRDLPQKHEEPPTRTKMPQVQLKRYKAEIAAAKEDNIKNGSVNRNSVLKSLQCLRDISDHPYLVEGNIVDFTTQELVESSAKLMATIDIIHKIQAKNDKVIVFADRKETQKMLQKVLYDTFGLRPRVINGETPTSESTRSKSKLSRQQAIDDFEAVDGFNIIVMSPLAAGIGLNVTAANHVIHYSRHWNPAKEQQASDRAYRIGQQKEVYIYYPMAVADGFRSFDEVLDDLLYRKKSLATATLFPSDQTEVTPEDLFGSVFDCEVDSHDDPIDFDMASKLLPASFEALAAAIFGKLGYNTILTPVSNDKGADVVCFSDSGNLLVQVKQSKNALDLTAVQEIAGAKGYYEQVYGKQFSTVVFTNSSLNQNAVEYASASKVTEYNNEDLKGWLAELGISIRDLMRAEKTRLTRI